MMYQMLLIFCLCVTVAFATPDVSHLLHGNHDHHHTSSGYTYEKPTDFVQTPYVTENLNIRTSYIPPASGTHITTSDEYQPNQQYDVGSSSGGINYVQQPNIVIKYSPTSYAKNYNNAGATTSTLHDEQYRYGVTGQQIQQDTVTIRPIPVTDFYSHTAPQDQIIDYGTKYVNVGHPQRSQKVIFIKPPSYHGKAHIVPILPRNDEKTFVYVLNKQPTFETTVDAQQQPSVPTKPDVVFLKYKTAEEARRAEEKIRNAFESGHVPSGGASDEGLEGVISTAVSAVTGLLSGGIGSTSVAESPVSNILGTATGLTGILGGRYGDQYGGQYGTQYRTQYVDQYGDQFRRNLVKNPNLIYNNNYNSRDDFQGYPLTTTYAAGNPSTTYVTNRSSANYVETIPSVSYITTNPSTVSQVTHITDEYLPPGKK